ncbi:MAG: tetraacyldisaccharide 4'-kinase [Verrucomicrobiales bacterium]
MRRIFEGLEQFIVEVILDQRQDALARGTRFVFYQFSHLYRGVVRLRLWLYRKRVLKEHPLGALVISVGNLTVGGTGKTPVVEKLARELTAGGRHVAILSRGYKSKQAPVLRRFAGKHGKNPPRLVTDGTSIFLDSRLAGDEPYMLAKNLRGVAVLVDRSRVKSGLFALQHLESDTLLLDDGLQHLHLPHRIDIVLIDRNAPFGNEYMLPRGTLREPPEHLRRASYIILTKCGEQEEVDLKKRLRSLNPVAPIIEASHRMVALHGLWSDQVISVSALQGRRVGALSGIARPESFEDALRELGAQVVAIKRFEDHHRYRERDIQNFLNRCLRRGVDMIVTTEKDAVRLPRVENEGVEFFYLRMEIEILRGQEAWDELIHRICQPAPIRAPEVLTAT